MMNKLKRRVREAGARPRRWLRVNLNRLRNGRPAVEEEKRGKFVIARIMGNDLFPRHDDGQMLRNLRFILENETEFPGCTKIFVLNRLFDPDRQKAALRLLEQHGAEALVIPFEPAAYAETGWDLDAFGSLQFFSSERFKAEPKLMQERMQIWALGPKIRYAMNINGARNAAIRAGRDRAEWTAVLDGNCIFTTASFARFRDDCLSEPFAPYVIIPMQRLERNSDFGGKEPNPSSTEEPQIAFHHSARQEFDERFPYGLRDKTVLLKSLGVPGLWQGWEDLGWIPEDDPQIADVFFYKTGRGGVFRLSSGGTGFERKGAHDKRYGARNASIFATVSRLNRIYGTKDAAHEAAILGDGLSEKRSDRRSGAIGRG